MPLFTAEHTTTTNASPKEVHWVLANCAHFPEFVPGCLSAKPLLPDASPPSDAPDAGATWIFVFRALLRFLVTVRVEVIGTDTVLVTQVAGELLSDLVIRLEIRPKETETVLACRFDVALLGQIPEASWRRFASEALPAALSAVGQRAEQQAALSAV